MAQQITHPTPRGLKIGQSKLPGNMPMTNQKATHRGQLIYPVVLREGGN